MLDPAMSLLHERHMRHRLSYLAGIALISKYLNSPANVMNAYQNLLHHFHLILPQLDPHQNLLERCTWIQCSLILERPLVRNLF